MLKRTLAIALAGAALFAGSAVADEASVKKALEAAFPGLPIDGVRKTPIWACTKSAPPAN